MTIFKNVKPINGKIVVRDVPQEETTKSGIYIPETRKPDSVVLGTVLYTSPLKTKIGETRPADVSPGDMVIYSFNAGRQNVEKDDEGTIRFVDQIEILGIVVE